MVQPPTRCEFCDVRWRISTKVAGAWNPSSDLELGLSKSRTRIGSDERSYPPTRFRSEIPIKSRRIRVGSYKFGHVKSCHFILQPLNDPLYTCFATISHQKSLCWARVVFQSVATQEQPGEKKVWSLEVLGVPNGAGESNQQLKGLLIFNGSHTVDGIPNNHLRCVASSLYCPGTSDCCLSQ